jgi:dihydropteroate synthase
MGIINLTPDSFYSGSRFSGIDAMLKQAEEMLEEGATILDIGGQSTRPGSERISADEELSRVMKPLSAIAKEFPQSYISIDTYHSKVVKETVAAGASMVNDISAGSLDAEMIPTVANLEVPYVLMHMKGEPGTMQKSPAYEDVANDVLDFFIYKKAELVAAGINDIIIDPGFGFGKTIAHNFQLLKRLAVLKMLNAPILAGLSRKSTVYKTLGIAVEDSLNGTTVLNTMALMNGASILRVHDVKAAMEVVKLYATYND